ncbi:mucin-2-like [Anguilla anguilla]|uniref:mucin-2-like n=1 Tax=Anguilla anguilla TaxID=7936 RepID=UPI0015A81E83|nr:mucin-2-like [Anguilla anguilla]
MEQQRSPVVEPQEGNLERRLRDLTLKWFTDTQAPLIARDGTVPPWFQGYISRKETEDLMKDQPEGCFLIRLSDKAIGYILSYRGQDRCRHFVITQNKSGQFAVSGDTKTHDSLANLIEYYKSCPIEPFGEKLTTSCFQTPSSEVYDVVQVDLKDRPTVSMKAMKAMKDMWSIRTPHHGPEHSPDHAPNNAPDHASDRKFNCTPDRTPNCTPNHTPNRTPDRTPNRTPDRTPNRTPDRTPNCTTNHTPNPTLNHTPNCTPDCTPNCTPNHTPNPTLNHTPNRTPDRTPNRTPNHTPNPTLNHTPNCTPDRTPNCTSNHTPNPTLNHTPNRTPDRTPTRTPDRTPNPTLNHTPSCTPYQDCPPALPPKTCNRRAAPTISYDLNTPPEILPRQPRGGAALRNSLSSSLNSQLVHNKSNTKIQPQLTEQKSLKISPTTHLNTCNAGLGGGSLPCIQPNSQEVKPTGGVVPAMGTVYSELNLETFRSVSLPILDNSQGMQHPYRQTAFNPPKLPSSPCKRATCQTYSLLDPREHCLQWAAQGLPSSSSLDKLNINPLYQTTWEDCQWAPHSCIPGPVEPRHPSGSQQDQDTYDQVPHEIPPARFLTDNTYELIPDQSFQGSSRTHPSISNTYELIQDQCLKDDLNSNTYETLNDLQPKHSESGLGIKVGPP